MNFPRITLFALSLALLSAQPAAASIISDGSSGVFRPTADFTLDLTGTVFPQYSSIFIDAGIRLTVLTPSGGGFGDLLAANDIFVNGIIDAGSGYLGLLAGNQIVLGAGSQVIAGSLNISATMLSLFGTIDVTGGTINAGTSSGSSPLPDLRSGVTISNGSGAGTISLGSGSSINIGAGSSIPVVGRVGPVSGSDGFILLDGGRGTISVDGGSIDLVGSGGVGVVTIGSPIPEPSTILLLLPGLALLALSMRRRGHV